MRLQFKCYTAERRQKVRDSDLNAIDYLEVLPRNSGMLNPLLLINCFRSVLELNRENVIIEGGIRVNNVKVEWASPAKTILENLDREHNEFAKNLTDEEKNVLGNVVEPERVLLVRPDRDGDFSIYTLQLVKDLDNRDLPPLGFDSVLSHVDFSFKVQCSIDIECRQEKKRLPQNLQEPIIDYMAKDYASFRRLMLDRLAVIMPEWKERNPADMSVMLVELLAYVGDHVSYFQDAVATEAYLGTARKRVSVKRHARLMNYLMHEGCNSRAWIFIGLSEGNSPKFVPEKTVLVTGSGDQGSVEVMEEDLDQILNKGNEVFETINCITLYEHHNEILFYTWGESRCCLPEGTTHATIRNDNGKFNLFLFNWNDVPGKDSTMLKHFLEERFAFDWMDDLEFEKIDEGGSNEKIFATDEVHHISIELWQERMQAVLMLEGRVHYKFTVMREGEIGDLKVYDLTLKTGDCLLFEEVDSPLQFLSSGGLKQNKIDFPLPTSPSPQALANPMHRHVVRLIETESKIDDLNGTPVIDITWDKEDALPFALCLWDFPQPITVARGNIVLADHGRTIRECLEDRYVCRKFQPRLQIKPLTHRGPLDPNSPASSVFRYEMQEVVPDIYIEEYDSNISDCKNIGKDRDPITWHAVTDLLSSERFRREFVIEVENDDTAQIRFGDNIMGLIPEPSTPENPRTLCAIYRVGNGKKGNVGADKITRIVRSKNFHPDGIELIRNPMPSQGGVDPETLEEVRQYSPQAFRKQERAVTESDYTDVLGRHPEVSKASAIFRWFGSWYTVLIAIDRVGARKVDAEFKAEIRKYLEKYRLAGLDIEIIEPQYVPLYIRMNVCVAPNHFRDNVKRELMDVFSNRDLPDGHVGFFHPDNFTFGQPVYLSKIYESAMKVQGISSVSITGPENFRRLTRSPEGELYDGAIRMEISEIARVDNDLNFPDNGKFEFNMEGGQ